MDIKKLGEMSRTELVTLCRYYHGEETSPHEGKGKDPNINMLWSYECGWVNDVVNGHTEGIEEYLSEYLNAGLQDFMADDGVPIHLKALLFNRYMRGSMDGNPEPFKKFYCKYY